MRCRCTSHTLCIRCEQAIDAQTSLDLRDDRVDLDKLADHEFDADFNRRYGAAS